MSTPAWETILIDGGHRFDRISVPGGWIYRDARIGAMVFVPAPRMSLGEMIEHDAEALKQAGA